MKNQGSLLMTGGRGWDINRQSLLRNPKVFCRRSLNSLIHLQVSIVIFIVSRSGLATQTNSKSSKLKVTVKPIARSLRTSLYL